MSTKMEDKEKTSKKILDFLGVKLVLGKDINAKQQYALYSLAENAKYICSSKTDALLWTSKMQCNEDAALFMLKQECWLDAKSKYGTPDFNKTVNVNNKLFRCQSMEEVLMKIDLEGD